MVGRVEKYTAENMEDRIKKRSANESLTVLNLLKPLQLEENKRPMARLDFKNQQYRAQNQTIN